MSSFKWFHVKRSTNGDVQHFKVRLLCRVLKCSTDLFLSIVRRKCGLVGNGTSANFVFADLKALTRFRISSAGGWVAL